MPLDLYADDTIDLEENNGKWEKPKEYLDLFSDEQITQKQPLDLYSNDPDAGLGIVGRVAKAGRQFAQSIGKGAGQGMLGLATQIENAPLMPAPYQTPGMLRDIRSTESGRQYYEDVKAGKLVGKNPISEGLRTGSEAYKVEEGRPLGFFSDVTKGLAEFIPSMALSAVNPVMGTAATFEQLTGSKYDQYIKEGKDEKTAFDAATLSALLNTPVEQAGNLLQIGKIAKLLDTKALSGVSNGFKKYLKTIFENALTEGGEELVQQNFDIIADQYANNPEADPIELGKNVWNQAATWKNVAESGKAFAGGFAGGFLMTGAASGAGVAQEIINEKGWIGADKPIDILKPPSLPPEPNADKIEKQSTNQPIDILKPGSQGLDTGQWPVTKSAEESAAVFTDKARIREEEGRRAMSNLDPENMERLKVQYAQQDPYLVELAMRMFNGEQFDLKDMDDQDLRSLTMLVGPDVIKQQSKGITPLPVREDRGLVTTQPPVIERQRALPPPPADIGPEGPGQFAPTRRGPISEETGPVIPMGQLAKGDDPKAYTGNELRQIAKDNGLEIPKNMLKKTDMINFIKQGVQGYDQKNIEGLPGSEREGQTVEQGQSQQRSGGETTETGGILQTQEEIKNVSQISKQTQPTETIENKPVSGSVKNYPIKVQRSSDEAGDSTQYEILDGSGRSISRGEIAKMPEKYAIDETLMPTVEAQKNVDINAAMAKELEKAQAKKKIKEPLKYTERPEVKEYLGDKNLSSQTHDLDALENSINNDTTLSKLTSGEAIVKRIDTLIEQSKLPEPVKDKRTWAPEGYAYEGDQLVKLEKAQAKKAGQIKESDIKKDIIDGKISAYQAEKLGHFKTYPNLLNKIWEHEFNKTYDKEGFDAAGFGYWDEFKESSKRNFSDDFAITEHYERYFNEVSDEFRKGNRDEEGKRTPPISEPQKDIVVKDIKAEEKESKEPWQMTRDEYHDNLLKTNLSEFKKIDEASKVAGQNAIEYIQIPHKKAVQQALSEGKPVPEEVLKDYPDLQPSEKPAVEKAKIEDFGEKIGGARKDTADRGYTMSGIKKEKSSESGWQKRYKALEDTIHPGTWFIADTEAKRGYSSIIKDKKFTSEEEAKAAIPLYAVAQKHVVYNDKENKEGWAIFKRVSDRKLLKVVNQVFPSREEGMKYMAEHAKEILDIKTTFGEEILPVPEKAERKGPERRTEDATPEMFIETFAPRGIEFGNWNNQDERQQVMNYAYDGLLDLAEVINVPPKALMLNGDLAIAFGARGQGLSGAKAHYERDYGVINLTKMSGAGSLAHEWMHAFDHYLGKLDTKASSEKEINKRGDSVFKTKGTVDYLSAGTSYRSKMRPELLEAYENLIQTMYKKAEQYVEDTKVADKFLSAGRQSLREELDKVRKYLLADYSDYRKKGGKPASAEQIAEFDKLADILVEGGNLTTEYREIPEMKARAKSKYSLHGRHTNDTLEAMNVILKNVRNRQGFDSEGTGYLDRVRASMSTYLSRIQMFEDAKNQTEKTKKVPTNYAIEARKMDQARVGDYWSNPHEMTARAFSSYVEDKISEQGNQSDFLVYHAHGGIFLPMIDGFVARPYPEGQERVEINKLFDIFIKQLKTEETDKGIKLFSISDKQKQSLKSVTKSDIHKAFPGSQVIPYQIEVDGQEYPGFLVTMPKGQMIAISPAQDFISIPNIEQVAEDYGISVPELKKKLSAGDKKIRGAFTPDVAEKTSLIELLASSDPGDLSHEKFHFLFSLLNKEDRGSIFKRYQTEEKAAEAFRKREGFTQGFWEKIQQILGRIRDYVFGDTFAPVFEQLQGQAEKGGKKYRLEDEKKPKSFDKEMDDLLKDNAPIITKESKLAQRTEAEAIEDGMIEDGWDNLSQYKTKPEWMKVQSEKAAKFINADYERAKRVALGEEDAPEGIEVGFIWRGIKNRARSEHDNDLMYRLGTESKVPEIGSKLGQQIKAFDDSSNTDDPEVAMRQIGKLRKEKNKKMGKKVVSIEKVKELKKQLAEAEKKLADYENKYGDKQAEREVDRLIDETPRKSYKKINQSDITSRIKTAIDSNQELSDISTDIQELAKYFISQGVNTRGALVKAVYDVLKSGPMPDITLRGTMDAISGYGKWKPLSKDDILIKLRDLKGQMQQVAKLEDMQAGRAPLKTGIERRTPTDEERRLIQQVEEMKKELGIETVDPEKQLKSALDSVKTRLSNQIKDLEYQITSGEKIVKKKTGLKYDVIAERLKVRRDELKKEFDNLFGKPEISDEQRIQMAIKATEKSIIEYTRKINENDLTPMNKRTPVQSEELNKLRADRDELKKKIKELRDLAKPKRTQEEISLQRLKTRLKNETEKLTGKLQNLDLVKIPRKESVYDAEARKLKETRDNIKSALNAAMEAKGEVTREEADRLINLADAIDTAKKEMEEGGDRFKYGAARELFRQYVDELKGSKRPIKTMLKDRYSEYKETWKDNKAKVLIWDAPMDILNTISDIAVSLNATWDNSFIGRQGRHTLLTHPSVWIPNAVKSFKDIYDSLKSEHGAELVRSAGMADFYSRANYEDYVTAKLFTKTEEETPSSMPGRIPVLGRTFKASDNAFFLAATRMRLDTYDLLKKIAEKQGVDTKDKVWIQETGKLINSVTGRGSLGSVGDSKFLKLVLWAPKMMKGHVDVLTAHYGGAGLKHSFARQQARQNLAKIAGFTLLAAAVISGLGELFGKDDLMEWDPRSSDFMKLKIGNTRFDLTAGTGSYITLLARTIATLIGAKAIKNTQTGKLEKLNTGKWGSKTLFDVMIDFLVNKTAPFFGAGIDIARGKNYDIEKPTVGNIAYDLTTPIGVRNFIKAFSRKAGTTAEEIVGNLLDLVGVNANTYDTKAEQRKKYRELRKAD